MIIGEKMTILIVEFSLGKFLIIFNILFTIHIFSNTLIDMTIRYYACLWCGLKRGKCFGKYVDGDIGVCEGTGPNGAGVCEREWTLTGRVLNTIAI